MNFCYELTNAQRQLNPQLITVVKHQQTSEFQRPIPAQQQEVFEQLKQYCRQPFILDSGCGTGMSTQYLSKLYPDHLVIGIDRSLHRLNKNVIFRQQKVHPAIARHENMLLCQAECVDLWRLLAQHNLHCHKHFLLYPNPYPKTKHYKRRFYAHPAFSACLAISPELIVRSNWLLYLRETQHVCKQIFHRSAVIKRLELDEGITCFEEKYRRANMPLYECQVQKA